MGLAGSAEMSANDWRRLSIGRVICHARTAASRRLAAERVPEVSASDVRNLQVIPWLVNLSRGNGTRLEQLVGWPRRRRVRERRS